MSGPSIPDPGRCSTSPLPEPTKPPSSLCPIRLGFAGRSSEGRHLHTTRARGVLQLNLPIRDGAEVPLIECAGVGLVDIASQFFRCAPAHRDGLDLAPILRAAGGQAAQDPVLLQSALAG